MGFWDGSGISWTISKQSAPRSRQITTTTPHQSIFTGQMLFLFPTNSVKALKANFTMTWLTNHHSHGRQISPIISTLTWWAAVTGLGQHWWLRQLTMALPTTTTMTTCPSTCPLMLSDCESSAADCQTVSSPTLPGLKTSQDSHVITNEKL